MSTQRESRPDHEAAIPRTHSGFSVPDTPDNSHTDAPPLPSMSPRARAIWFEAHELGRTEGFVAGWDAAHEDMAVSWRRAHEIVQDIAHREPLDVLADRRGEPERAQRQRALLAERGVLS